MERPNRQENMRSYFAHELALQMRKNKDIWVAVGDLGFGLFDYIKSHYPERFINVGAAEQSLIGVGVGLAMEGKIPICYSITTFLLYRGFETIRNYANAENIPIKLIASGRDRDYMHDGPSHFSEDARKILPVAFPNISTYWPDTKEEIPQVVNEMLTNGKPSFVSLKR